MDDTDGTVDEEDMHYVHEMNVVIESAGTGSRQGGLFCVCNDATRLPGEFMVACHSCGDSFHGRCVNVLKATATFICPRCSRRGPSLVPVAQFGKEEKKKGQKKRQNKRKNIKKRKIEESESDGPTRQEEEEEEEMLRREIRAITENKGWRVEAREMTPVPTGKAPTRSTPTPYKRAHYKPEEEEEEESDLSSIDESLPSDLDQLEETLSDLLDSAIDSSSSLGEEEDDFDRVSLFVEDESSGGEENYLDIPVSFILSESDWIEMAMDKHTSIYTGWSSEDELVLIQRSDTDGEASDIGKKEEGATNSVFSVTQTGEHQESEEEDLGEPITESDGFQDLHLLTFSPIDRVPPPLPFTPLTAPQSQTPRTPVTPAPVDVAPKKQPIKKKKKEAIQTDCYTTLHLKTEAQRQEFEAMVRALTETLKNSSSVDGKKKSEAAVPSFNADVNKHMERLAKYYREQGGLDTSAVINIVAQAAATAAMLAQSNHKAYLKKKKETITLEDLLDTRNLTEDDTLPQEDPLTIKRFPQNLLFLRTPSKVEKTPNVKLAIRHLHSKTPTLSESPLPPARPNYVLKRPLQSSSSSSSLRNRTFNNSNSNQLSSNNISNGSTLVDEPPSTGIQSIFDSLLPFDDQGDALDPFFLDLKKKKRSRL